MKICMIGAGYVGLVSATCFSEFGWTVTCVDNDPERLAQMAMGRSPIYEPGLSQMLKRNSSQGRLEFTTSLEKATDHAEVLFIAVGTPPVRLPASSRTSSSDSDLMSSTLPPVLL